MTINTNSLTFLLSPVLASQRQPWRILITPASSWRYFVKLFWQLAQQLGFP